MNIDDIDDFQWVPKQKEWLFDVSLLLGSYAGLMFDFGNIVHCNMTFQTVSSDLHFAQVILGIALVRITNHNISWETIRFSVDLDG